MTWSDSRASMLGQAVYLGRTLNDITPDYVPLVRVGVICRHNDGKSGHVLDKKCAPRMKRMTIKGMITAKPHDTKNRYQVDIGFETNTTIACTLLMPQKNMRKYRRRLRKFDGSVRKYFQYLVREYISSINGSKLPKPGSLTASYQAAGQNLRKIHLRVKPSDWNQIGLVARTCGYSICHLFVFLMEREITKSIASTVAGTRKRRRVILKKVEFREVRLDGPSRCTRSLTINSGNSPP